MGWPCKDWFLIIFNCEDVVVSKWLIIVIFSLCKHVVVLKGLILDYWLIWLCQIASYGIANCCLSVCVYAFRLSYRPEHLAKLVTGQLSSAIGLHFQSWHHCLLCVALLIMWLMSVNFYVACLFAYFHYWCIMSNLGMQHLRAYLLLAHIWQ